MECIEDGEHVVGRDPEGTVREEGETPCDAKHETQAQNDCNATAILVWFFDGCIASFETEEPGQRNDERCEGEEEDQRVVSNIDNVVDVSVIYPAPLKRKTNELSGIFKRLKLSGITIKFYNNFNQHVCP